MTDHILQWEALRHAKAGYIVACSRPEMQEGWFLFVAPLDGGAGWVWRADVPDRPGFQSGCAESKRAAQAAAEATLLEMLTAHERASLLSEVKRMDKKTREYSLDELVAGITDQNVHPEIVIGPQPTREAADPGIVSRGDSAPPASSADEGSH